jgi:hypothetical protein
VSGSIAATVALAVAFIWSGLAILAAHSIREVRAAQEPA